MTRRHTRLALLALATFTAACGDDGGPDGAGDSELITQVTLTITPQGGAGQTQVVSITDPDGIGPTPPGDPTGTLLLAPGVIYEGTVTFTNTTTDPDTDITEEVEAEGDEHRVFYTLAGTTGVTAAVTDTDVDGQPLGLTFRLTPTAEASGAGTLRVVLSHYDEEPKGNGQTPSQETDVDVSFEVVVTGS